jgi:hypothetical protein
MSRLDVGRWMIDGRQWTIDNSREIKVCKNCAQAVYASGQKYGDVFAQLGRSFAQGLTDRVLFHNFIHPAGWLLPPSFRGFYTSIKANFTLLNRGLSALSIGPTTTTTSLINT